jgi:stringent starvation protein B
MKNVSLAILISLGAVTGAAYAQESGVTMSTDPAKAADVEQRAQDLQNRQQTMESAPAPMKHQKSSPHHNKKGAKADASSS